MEALDGRLADPKRQSRKGEPPEQMVVVPVRGHEPVHLEPRLGQDARQSLELVREVGRVQEERFAAGAQRHGIGLPEPAGDDQRVAVRRRYAHWRPRRLSAAWPLPERS
jgi:hypothetical protein